MVASLVFRAALVLRKWFSFFVAGFFLRTNPDDVTKMFPDFYCESG
jgi:hypothetical protein